MPYLLEIENFASISKVQVLDLRISGTVPADPYRFAEIFPSAGVYVPKVVAIYGANASGKTNVLRALEFLFKMAASVEDPRPPCLPFNSANAMQEPTRIAIEFGGVMDPSEPELALYGIYRYELIVKVISDSGLKILSESLRRKPLAEGKWQRVFERDAEGNVKGSDVFPVQGYSHLVKTLRPNATVIASFAFFGHPAAVFFNSHAKRALILNVVLGPSDEQLVHRLLSTQPDSLLKLNNQLARIDLGLEQMHYVTTDEGPQPRFKHSGLLEEMNWSLESHGTRSFIRIFPLIDAALRQGTLCVIDELDSAIHPLLLPEIIRWFHDSENSNPHNSQLWFTSHSPSLLEDLKKEEVVLCEKDRLGQTSVFSLMDVKVRRDDNLYRKYLGGAYGGVPLIG